jgi:hypothetical protein
MSKRPVIPGCDIEGEILERARIARKKVDPKYTQKYLAGLVDKDQNYWTQWRIGTTRILDEYWLVFAIELGFDAFKTRPELLEKHQLISKLIDVRGQRSPRVERHTKADRATLISTIEKMDATEIEKIISAAAAKFSARDLVKFAQLLLSRAEHAL